LEFGRSSFGKEFGVAEDVATWYWFSWAFMRAAGGVDGEWYAVRCTGSLLGVSKKASIKSSIKPSVLMVEVTGTATAVVGAIAN
jgi:hypothetical protein